MLPRKYMALIVLVLILLAGITFAMNLKRNRKIRLAGTAISAVVIILVVMFTSYFNRTMKLIAGGDQALRRTTWSLS